ncbi:RHS repeat-associated core domain-containing protein, partial [Burkholderia sp. Bp9031]|uniref:RHS repeat-associated core domain-containing protein n=1 Tax=Burkholderia sp. Bp9031 TaxID=2184566 RepID=UPI00163A131D
LKSVVTKDRLGIGTTHFEYDAFGRRIRKLNGSYASTDFLWDGMRLVQETYHDRSGEEALTYLYEPDSYVPLARIDQGVPAANDTKVRDTVYYFHNDVSGLPEELSDADGELVWQARYKVWGNAVQEEWIARAPQRATPSWDEVSAAAPAQTRAPRSQNLRFQGQYLDRETGLHYNTLRFYDPDIGRFVTSDPIGLLGGTNFYQYAQNPITWIDPWGLTCGSAAGAPKDPIARIAPGSLPAAEESALLNTLSHIDNGTVPTGPLAKKWGTQFKNWAGDLPGGQGPTSPYREYRVAPSPGTTGAGTNRIVMNNQTGEMYYTWTHYGDTGNPAFVQIR